MYSKLTKRYISFDCVQKIEFRGPKRKWFNKSIHMPSKIRPSALKMKQCIQHWGLTQKKWISSKSCRILHLLFIHLMLKPS